MLSQKDMVAKINELIEVIINLKVGLFIALSMLEDITPNNFPFRDTEGDLPKIPKKRVN